MDARVIFSKETKRKMQKDMTVREKGGVLFDRLEELDKDGTLSKAKSRADVATMVGYSNERAKAGYAWVSNLIRRGHLTETILSWSPSGRAEAEYHITGSKPDYGYEERTRRKQEKIVGQELRRWQDKVAAEQILQAPILSMSDEIPTIMPTIEITKGDITIKINALNKQVEKLIRDILGGKNEY